MILRDDPWLAGILGFPAYAALPEPGDDEPGRAAALGDLFPRNGRSFGYAKVETSAIGVVRTLAACGFYTVDVNVNFARSPDAPPPGAPPPEALASGTTPPGSSSPADGSSPAATFSCGPASSGDWDDILDIAGSTFRFSRFHLDPAIGTETAHLVKRRWMESYRAGKRGLETLVARENHRVLGFLAVIAGGTDEAKIRRIDLVGVARGYERRGLGRQLTRYFIERHSPGAVLLEVGTQAANVPSIRMYENLGFRLAGSQYVLHRHSTSDAP